MSMQRIAPWALFLMALLATAPATAGTGKVIGWEVDGKHYATELEACRAAAKYNSARGRGVFTGKFERQGEDTILCFIRDEDGSIGSPQVMRVWGPADEPDRPLAEGQAVPLAEERGMTSVDDAIFRGLAQNKKLIFIVRDSNPAAVRYTGKAGYAPKPEALKAKSIKAPEDHPYLGLVSVSPVDLDLQRDLAEQRKSFRDYVMELWNAGFAVGPEPYFLVEDRKTRAKFYSDIDLHGVYDESGKQRWTPALRSELLNSRLKDRLIQHGPHDCWEKRNSAQAGRNRGPQAPVTVYMPDGNVYSLGTSAQMEAFYKQRKLPWPYAPGAKAKWCE